MWKHSAERTCLFGNTVLPWRMDSLSRGITYMRVRHRWRENVAIVSTSTIYMLQIAYRFLFTDLPLTGKDSNKEIDLPSIFLKSNMVRVVALIHRPIRQGFASRVSSCTKSAEQVAFC
jgi:hypothetical protein